MYVKDKN